MPVQPPGTPSSAPMRKISMIMEIPIAYRQSYSAAAQAVIPAIHHLRQRRNTMQADGA